MYHSLFESLCMISDPRIDRKKVYPLDFLLPVVFLSTLSGSTSWYEIEDYAKEYEEELKTLYEKFIGDRLYAYHALSSFHPQIGLLFGQGAECILFRVGVISIL